MKRSTVMCIACLRRALRLPLRTQCPSSYMNIFRQAQICGTQSSSLRKQRNRTNRTNGTVRRYSSSRRLDDTRSDPLYPLRQYQISLCHSIGIFLVGTGVPLLVFFFEDYSKISMLNRGNANPNKEGYPFSDIRDRTGL